ncbi:MAG: formyl transferase [Planctomycetia bacterium]|nr:formyl transferase [Planctomycetia bacterium]
MRTVLICHTGASLDTEGMARWLSSFTDLAGLIILHGTTRQMWGRLRREMRRTGALRSLDVLAFRLYYKLALERGDRHWESRRLAELCSRYAPLTDKTTVIHATSPNSPEVQSFLRGAAPDLMIARCKMLLKRDVFEIPRLGTFVMHPGVCPEYRNSHGCFWALAQSDLQKVGMTLLKIDAGVDTGPIYGDIRTEFDERHESHIVIQQRMVFDNLDELQHLLLDVADGQAQVLPTAGRPSQTWGQPWLTEYVKWRLAARRRRRHADCPHLS